MENVINCLLLKEWQYCHFGYKKGLSKDASPTPNMFPNIRNQFSNAPEMKMAKKSRKKH